LCNVFGVTGKRAFFMVSTISFAISHRSAENFEVSGKQQGGGRREDEFIQSDIGIVRASKVRCGSIDETCEKEIEVMYGKSELANA
jgi:hypothetical protein